MKLSIVIPVYRGSKTLIPLFLSIKDVLSEICRYEVIFICDQPKDNSWDVVRQLRNENPGIIKGIILKRNCGQHRAILEGISRASGEYIVTMDEDLQHDPRYIPEMLDYLERDRLDVVYGKFERSGTNKLRDFESDLGRKIARFLMPSLYSEYSPFRIIRSRIAAQIRKDKGIVFIDGLLSRITSAFGSYPVKLLKNQRPTSYSWMKLGLMAFSIFLWYSRTARIILASVLVLLILFTSDQIIEATFDWQLVTGSILVFLGGLISVSAINGFRSNNLSIAETTE